MRLAVEALNGAIERGAGAAFEKFIATLPLVTYRTGDTVLGAGLNTGRLLIIKTGAVAILKDGVEIAKVDQPGAVLGELSALLDQPHIADVRALADSQFHVADARVLEKDPMALLHVARILARRLVAADSGIVELKKQLQAGQSAGMVRKMLDKIEASLKGAGAAVVPGYWS
jgi:CRP/FNR family transcriptional regulator, cyclic AMP receptor protein